MLKSGLVKKNILISGVNGTIGSNLAKTLKQYGANIIGIDKYDNKNLKKILHKFYKVDVAKKKNWLALREKLKREKINVDILINNAGFTNHTNKKKFKNNFFKTSEDDILQVFSVNTFGVIYGCQVFGEDFVKRKKGIIINIASMYGIISPKHHIYENTNIYSPITYAASKSGVITITKYLATLFAKYNVRVNSISPGGIKDASHKKLWLNRFGKHVPIGRMANVKEIMNAVIYLIDDDSSYSIGSNLVVDGGWTSW
jgi:NAD(P)-dependent dehydrogenase (short-subunit alcohol dehydrogenase family)